MAHAAVRVSGSAGTVPAGTVPAGTGAGGRLRRRRLDLAGTPGRLWLLLIGLVVLSLGWGTLSAFTLFEYSSAASSVVTTREALSLDAQQIYSHLSDANDTAATAFLMPGPEPAGTLTRYASDIAAASSGIEQVTAEGGGTGTAAQDLAVLSRGLPTYAQEMGTAEADNRLALPLGAAYLREASKLMRDTLLQKAQDLYAAENGLAGLAGQKVCATTGSDSVATIENSPVHPKLKAVQVQFWTDCLVLLQQDQVAAISTDDAILYGLTAQDPFTEVVGPDLQDEPYGLAVSRQHAYFVRFVNAVIARQESDGGWEKSYKRWVNPAGAPPPVPHYAS